MTTSTSMYVEFSAPPPSSESLSLSGQQRWLALLLLPLTVAGGHFFRASLSSLEVFLLDDEELGITSTGYGAFVSSFSICSLFLPLFGGAYLDARDMRRALVFFLLSNVLSVLLACGALFLHSFPFLLLSGVLFGASQCVLSIACRSLLSVHFHGLELAFALGVLVGISALAKSAARAVVAPVALKFGDYRAAFGLLAVVCLCSALCGAAYGMVCPQDVRGGGEREGEEDGGDEENPKCGAGERSRLLGGGVGARADTNTASYQSTSHYSSDGAPPAPPSSLTSPSRRPRPSQSSPLPPHSPLSPSPSATALTESSAAANRLSSLTSFRAQLQIGGLVGFSFLRGTSSSSSVSSSANASDAAHSHNSVDNSAVSSARPEPEDAESSASLSPFVSPAIPSGVDNADSRNGSVFALNFKGLSATFWLVVILHAMFGSVAHLFSNISGDFLHSSWGLDPEEAGYVSSLLSVFAVVGAPLTGFVIDKLGGQLYVVFLSSILCTKALHLLAYGGDGSSSPLVPILMLSLAECCAPTVLASLVPLSVPFGRFGVAFGISEILESFGQIVGNVVVGYLKDRSGSYVPPLEFILSCSGGCVLLSAALIVRDKTKDSILNTPWESMAKKKNKYADAIEKWMRRKTARKGAARSGKGS